MVDEPLSAELELFLWHLQGALLKTGTADLVSAHWVLLYPQGHSDILGQ